MRAGRTRLRLALQPEHANNLGIAHGGALCTLLDVALGTAARLQAGRPVVTLDMQTPLPRPRARCPDRRWAGGPWRGGR